MMIGIIAATVQEREALCKAFGAEAKGPMEYVRGRMEGKDVVLVQAGIGKVNAALCAQKMIDLYQPEAIINVGVAGALDPDLHVGDLVISRDAVQHDFDTMYFGDSPGYVSGVGLSMPADQALMEKAEKAASALGLAYRVGRVASGDQFIASPEKKEWIATTFQASCTEMEGAAIAQVALLNQVPFLIIRAISDGADDGAPVSYYEFVEMAAERAVKLIDAMLKS